MLLQEIDKLRPLDPNDLDFAAAKQALKDASLGSNAETKNAPYLFFLIDGEGSEPADIVSLVSLKGIGNIARGSPDWDV